MDSSFAAVYSSWDMDKRNDYLRIVEADAKKAALISAMNPDQLRAMRLGDTIESNSGKIQYHLVKIYM